MRVGVEVELINGLIVALIFHFHELLEYMNI